ncbi:hypothetical protein M422DRAFT_259490 [Sphaerobolus stellatus SS14]|uniref:Unplaced genomic scaffold SPHSTscaffold_90, whole genome shotgun sequence n=1 Tax=Sphaerobolus stellatus (strain SS14) TaxID=990650 RepID=A0A0C9V8P2_SPHS4|nr:hypothetical protein M422DRAFT_259490 [Sphaerobolus stellatus SS14]
MQCGQCILDTHALQPLHRLEKWNGKCFISESLASMGLCVSLGHSGKQCDHRDPGPRDFTVLDSNGIHKINLDFCACGDAEPRIQQLLSLQSKLSAYDFYTAMERITENASAESSADCYMPFSHIARERTHLKMLKRAGYGDHTSFKDIPDRGLALLCPACPQPEWNLPADWKEAPPE